MKRLSRNEKDQQLPRERFKFVMARCEKGKTKNVLKQLEKLTEEEERK